MLKAGLLRFLFVKSGIPFRLGNQFHSVWTVPHANGVNGEVARDAPGRYFFRRAPNPAVIKRPADDGYAPLKKFDCHYLPSAYFLSVATMSAGVAASGIMSTLLLTATATHGVVVSFAFTAVHIAAIV